MHDVSRILPALLILLAGCTRAEKAPARLATDDLGRSVRVVPDARRLVSLAPSVTELVFAAGAGDRLVGVTDADDYPAPVADLPRIQALPLDFETVVAMEPDLVLASDQINDPRDASRLENLGIPTWFVAVHSLEDVFRTVQELGELLGTADTASAAADSLRAVLTTIGTGPVDSPPAVLVLIGTETLFAFGEGSYVHHMISLAGGRSVTEEFDIRAPILSEEYVVDTAPDVIIGAFGADFPPDSLLVLHPQWHAVPAVRNGRVYSVDPDLLLRPGPRLVEGVRTIAEILSGPAGTS